MNKYLISNLLRRQSEPYMDGGDPINKQSNSAYIYYW